MEHCNKCKHHRDHRDHEHKPHLPKLPDNFPSHDETYYGYPVENFWLMPQGTNLKLIIKAMNKIVYENKIINGIDTSFTGSPAQCLGLCYMELLVPNAEGTYYVYSSTNSDLYFFTTDASYLQIDNPSILTNPFRFYMWNSTIFNLAVQPTEEFPSEKEFKFKNAPNSNTVQKMELKATTTINQGGPYTTSTVVRNTIYIYYPNSIIYSIVDTNENKIYVMQTGNNQVTGTTPLTPENMIYTQQLIIDTLPPGMLFLCNQLGNNDTVLVVSSPESPATLMQDSLGNSYQLADPIFASLLYESL